MAADQRLDLRLLRRVQQALLAWLAPAWLADQPFRPLGREAVADIEHPGWAQPNQIGNCLIGHPALAKPDDLPPALLLGRSRQLAHVHVPHARPIWSIPASTQDNEGRINIAPFSGPDVLPVWHRHSGAASSGSPPHAGGGAVSGR